MRKRDETFKEYSERRERDRLRRLARNQRRSAKSVRAPSVRMSQCQYCVQPDCDGTRHIPVPRTCDYCEQRGCDGQQHRPRGAPTDAKAAARAAHDRQAGLVMAIFLPIFIIALTVALFA